MSFNPPPPFDPYTNYTEWYNMINSIVGFVTASTQLATTLRNSRCCFPETVEITELIGGVENDGKQLFNITDFPWFLQELINIQEANIPQLPQKCHITEVLPLIQFPLTDIMHGEPNNEPRTITLMDTKDFGDVDTSSFNGYQSHTPTSLYSVSSSFRRPESLQSDLSEQSCFLEQYTDSEQTIDSTNLQENFEKIEKEELQKEISEGKLLSHSSNVVTTSSLNSESQSQINKVYISDMPNDKGEIKEELILECNVEEIVIVPRKPSEFNEIVENKEECVDTNDYLLSETDINDYYEAKPINDKTNKENFGENVAATHISSKIVENDIEFFSGAKSVRKEHEKFHESLNKIEKHGNCDGNSSLPCDKFNMEQNIKDTDKAKMFQTTLPKNEPSQEDFTIIEKNGNMYVAGSKVMNSEKLYKDSTKVGNSSGGDNINDKISSATGLNKLGIQKSSNGNSKFNMEQSIRDIAKEKMFDDPLSKNVHVQEDSTVIKRNENKHAAGLKGIRSEKCYKDSSNVGSSSLGNNTDHKASYAADKSKIAQRKKLNINPGKETENSGKNKTKSITTEGYKVNKKQVVSNENTKDRHPDVHNKLSFTNQERIKQGKKKLTSKNGTKKHEHEDLKSDIDYITKNIVNCLNLAKKAKKEIPSASKNQPRVHKESIDVIETITPMNMTAPAGGSTLLRTRRAADAKSLSHEVVRTTSVRNEAPKTKIQGATKSSTAKLSPGRGKASIAPNLETADIFNHLEMKSCLKAGSKNRSGLRSCAFKEDDSTTFPKRPNTPTTINDSRILPKFSLIKDTTLKLSAAETLRKASELLRNAEEKALRPTSALKMQVISGEMRPTSSRNRKR